MSNTIDDFYSHRQLTEKLRNLADAAPDLASLSSIGESRDGREIWCVTLGDRTVDLSLSDRPAFLITANIHAQELAGSWVALSFIQRAVQSESETLNELLEERTFYVVPRLAPDGADDVLNSRNKSIRSRQIPLEADELQPDIIKPEDIDDDGHILTMRWESPDGDQTAIEGDRLLVSRRSEDDGPFYRSTLEGTVPKHHGGPVSDPNARSDFNRNFPTEEWEPFDWIGHGKHPLSEPETRAIADFLYDHSNVVGVTDLHTGNPAVFFPTKLRRPNPASEADADLIDEIGETAAEITGFPYLESYDEARGKDDQYTLPGSFKDFVYERFGIPVFILELGLFYNYLGLDTADLAMDPDEHERKRNRLALEWHEEHPDYGLFQGWDTVEHPQLGSVEVGGWDRMLYANPPKSELPDISGRVCDFVKQFATWAPDININVAANSVDESTYRIEATIVNHGSLPTNLTERGCETNPRSEPRVIVDGDDLVFATGGSERWVDHLDANGGSASPEWIVRTDTPGPVELTVESPRGVFATATVNLAEHR
jgi:hypothetical protein